MHCKSKKKKEERKKERKRERETQIRWLCFKKFINFTTIANGCNLRLLQLENKT